MLDYVYGHDQIVADFVAQLIPSNRGRGFGPNISAFGVVEGSDLIAGVVYQNWDRAAGVIEMSGAALPGRQWLTRETLRRAFQYPFLQLDCQLVVMRADADDQRLLRQLAALNFSFIRVPRFLGREKDGVICLLTQEGWEASRFSKRLHHTAALQEAAE